MKWHLSSLSDEQVTDFAQRYNVTPLVSRVALGRELSPSSFFFRQNPHLGYAHSPFLLNGVKDAILRLDKAFEEVENVAIFGDYDCDGIATSLILTEFLSAFDATPEILIPEYNTGHGVNSKVLQDLASRDVSLLCLLDCGRPTVGLCRQAEELGIDMLVLDHHDVAAGSPPLAAPHIEVNPKTSKDYPFKGLSAGSVVYKLMTAYFLAQNPFFQQKIIFVSENIAEDGHLEIEVTPMMNWTAQKSVVYSSVDDFAKAAAHAAIFVYSDAEIKKLRGLMLSHGIDLQAFPLQGELSALSPKFSSLSLSDLKKKSSLAPYRRSLQGSQVLSALFLSLTMARMQALYPQMVGVLDLVALTTIGDMMPLQDENIALQRAGLNAVNSHKRQPLFEILTELGLAGQDVTSELLARKVIPLFNSVGRIGQGQIACRFFQEEDYEERQKMLRKIMDLNEENKKHRYDLVEKFKRELSTNSRAAAPQQASKTLFLVSKEIPTGFTGLLAQSLAVYFKKIVIVVSSHHDGRPLVTGSVRSGREDADFGPFLEPYKEHFDSFGGHPGAYGFVFKSDQSLAAFRREVESAPQQWITEEPFLHLDAILSVPFRLNALWRDIRFFEPFGFKNDPIVFSVSDLLLRKVSFIGEAERHVKLFFEKNRFCFQAVYWGAGSLYKDRTIQDDQTYDAALIVTRSFYRQRETFSLKIADLRRAR